MRDERGTGSICTDLLEPPRCPAWSSGDSDRMETGPTLRELGVRRTQTPRLTRAQRSQRHGPHIHSFRAENQQPALPKSLQASPVVASEAVLKEQEWRSRDQDFTAGLSGSSRF